MGFRMNRVYKLRFAGEVRGLEVDVRSTSVGEMMRLREHSDEPAIVADMLAQYVTRWNYEDEGGETLPVTAESFLSIEEPLFALIVREWYKAATGVSAPLDDGSTSGGPSPEGSIPMDIP